MLVHKKHQAHWHQLIHMCQWALIYSHQNEI